MNRVKIVLLFFFFFVCGNSISQDRKKDSLLNVSRTAKVDTTRMSALMEYMDLIDENKEWYDKNLEIKKECEEKIQFEKGKRLLFYQNALATALSNESFYIGRSGEREKSLALNEAASEMFRLAGNDFGVATMYNNMAFTYNRMGNIPKALELYKQALNYYRKIDAKRDVGLCLINLSSISYMQDQNAEALAYLKEAEPILEGGTDKKTLGRCYVNLSSVYKAKNDSVNMFSYLFKAMKIQEEVEDKVGLAFSYNNLAVYHKEKKHFEQATFWTLKALALRRAIPDKRGIAVSLNTYAKILADQKKWDSVRIVLREAEEVAIGLKDPDVLQTVNEEKYKLALIDNDYSQALEYYKKYIVMRDSIRNEQIKKSALKTQFQYEFDKKEAVLVLQQEKNNLANKEELKRRELQYAFQKKEAALNAENEKKQLALKEEIKRKQITYEFKSRQKEQALINEKKELEFKEDLKRKEIENANQRRMSYFFIGGFLLMSVLSFFIYRGLKQNKKARLIIEQQKGKVEHQKELLEDKNKEILDSITYAKRLQEAILPPLKTIREHFPDSFVLYKPKDIVAGDFYFLESIGTKIIFAAADCTGHGVPGAMVSVVCSNALNRTVKEFGITDSGEILDKVRDLVMETFAKSESEVKDGMDISLCVFDSETNEMQWSGANNPLWIVRKNADAVEEVKADKQPIGKSYEPVPFHTNTIQLWSGDSFYLMTDGYEDQFGGEKGKKFRASKLRELLLSQRTAPMNQQRGILDEAFQSWRGDLEQVDDVCVIGVRIS